MLFSEVIGQEAIKQQLRQSVADGRIPHAQLLYGKRGVGKLQLALAFAQYLACENRTATDACGHCPSCLQYSKLQHPDLHLMFPYTKEDQKDTSDTYISKFREFIINNTYFDLNDWQSALSAANKQTIIYEVESSILLRQLSMKAYGNGYKVAIIWHAEKMNEVCQNKLLKMLEEPPEKTLFLLITERPELLLTTILSRVRQIHVPQVDDQDIALSLLASERVETYQDAHAIAHIASGSYLKALKITSSDKKEAENLELFRQLFTLATDIAINRQIDKITELRKWSDTLAAKPRERQKDFLDYAGRQLRENYISNFQIPQINYQTTDEQRFSRDFARFFSSNNISQLAEEFALAQRHIEQNANSKIVLFDLCLKTTMYVKKK